MKKAIIGKKVGMTQIFDETGKVIPVTVVEAGPCTVTQKKTIETDGYEAVQLGFESIKDCGGFVLFYPFTFFFVGTFIINIILRKIGCITEMKSKRTSAFVDIAQSDILHSDIRQYII